jgi:hypothetical protein
MNDRIVILKGDILESTNIDNKIVICTETTCSKTTRTFKAVDINSGDILELKYIDYRKSNSNKLYNKKELVELILLSETRIYKKVLACGSDFKTTVGRWNEHVIEQLHNKARINIDDNYNRVLR